MRNVTYFIIKTQHNLFFFNNLGKSFTEFSIQSDAGKGVKPLAPERQAHLIDLAMAYKPFD
jgi:hypothetical protein